MNVSGRKNKKEWLNELYCSCEFVQFKEVQYRNSNSESRIAKHETRNAKHKTQNTRCETRNALRS